MLTIREFLEKYPDDSSCLQEIFSRKFGGLEACPKCNNEQPKFYRVRKKRCFKCGKCGYEIFPLAGTMMHGSTTPIVLWFYAIYLFSQSKNGVSAKELGRHLGVSYRTAFRIGHKIRELMGNTQKLKLLGEVEIDESLFGGKAAGKRGWGARNKTCLFGMVQRGGEVRTVIVHDRKLKTLIPIVEQHVERGTTVYTDKFKNYRVLAFRGFNHKVKEGGWYCTNAIEGHWGNLKKSILGTHTWVSGKYLSNYLAEFDYRYNHRNDKGDEQSMFFEMIERL